MGTACKILISSRVEPLIKNSIAQKCEISLDGKNTDSLGIYIKARVTELQKQKRFHNINRSLWKTIEEKLNSKAKGMFLWVRLVINMLQAQVSEADLEVAIDKLPDGLEEAYGRIIDRLRKLSPTEKDRAFRILFWVCIACRSVSIHEVADGIILKPGRFILDRKTRIHDVNQDILEFCAPLLERSRRGALEVVHFSAQEYLLDKQTGPFVDIEQAHFNAAFACVVNLNSTLSIVPRHNKGDSDEHFEMMIVQGTYCAFKFCSRLSALSPTMVPFWSASLSKSLSITCIGTRCFRCSCCFRLQQNCRPHPGAWADKAHFYYWMYTLFQSRKSGSL